MKPLTAALIAASLAAPAHAQASSDTLADAVASAFETNPDVLAERKSRDSADEGVEQARALRRPGVSFISSLGAQYSDVDPALSFGGISLSQDGESYVASVGLEASQTVYNGGALIARTRAAEAAAGAAGAQLSATEQGLIIGVVAAYLNVRRGEAEVDIRRSNAAALAEQVQAAKDRFEVGEVTRTDVAQAEARFAGAEANLAASQAALESVRAEYQRLVGRAPAQLAAPPPAPRLPTGIEQAIAEAIRANPQIEASRAVEEAARQTLAAMRGELRPRVTIAGAAGFQESRQDSSLREFNIGASARLSVPLYTGGLLQSRIRQAQIELDRARLQTMGLERQVTAAVASAWHEVAAATRAAEASRTRVAAAELALEGTEQELAVGSRITLDVLIQEQELLEARLGLIDAERAAYIAAHRLLALLGGLSPGLFAR